MEKSYETGWEKHGESWIPPFSGQGQELDARALLDTLLPAGMVNAYAGSTAPSGWLLCDGQAVSATTYPRLFAAIKYTYGGSGDSFNLPNLKGKVIFHRDGGQTEFDTLAETGGAKTHTLTTAQIPGHTHWLRTDTRSTDHAHNIYARNADTGWQSHNHGHGFGTGGTSGGEVWTTTWDHSHQNSAGTGSEQPWGGGQWAASHTHSGHTGGFDTNHYHNFNHDHPSTNYQSESGWPGNPTHFHDATTDAGTGGGAAHPILPPYMVMNYCIKT